MLETIHKYAKIIALPLALTGSAFAAQPIDTPIIHTLPLLSSEKPASSTDSPAQLEAMLQNLDFPTEFQSKSKESDRPSNDNGIHGRLSLSGIGTGDEFLGRGEVWVEELPLWAEMYALVEREGHYRLERLKFQVLPFETARWKSGFVIAREDSTLHRAEMGYGFEGKYRFGEHSFAELSYFPIVNVGELHIIGGGDVIASEFFLQNLLDKNLGEFRIGLGYRMNKHSSIGIEYGKKAFGIDVNRLRALGVRNPGIKQMIEERLEGLPQGEYIGARFNTTFDF